VLGPLISEAGNAAKAQRLYVVPDNDREEVLIMEDDKIVINTDEGQGAARSGTKCKRNKPSHPVRLRKSDRWKEVSALEIALSSACTPEVLRQRCLKDTVDVEVALCKGQADRALDNLRTQLITSYTYCEQVKKGYQQAHHVMATSGKTQKRRSITLSMERL
jgi:hypothetical protein